MLDLEGQALRDELVRLMDADGPRELDEAGFDRLARRVFSYNYSRLPVYASYCRARARTPDQVSSWVEIPAVPTEIFKHMELMAEGATAEARFLTSGTTSGPERRGVHLVADLSLYRASLSSTFAAFLLPDAARLPFLSLVPRETSPPTTSSLAYMVDAVQRRFGAEGTATFADADGIDFELLDGTLRRMTAEQRPVLLLGTSAAFIHWIERLSVAGARHALPEGSRLMDTGGYKGGGRDVDPGELRRAYRERLGLPPSHCVNEYGMTEMLSQLYDSSLRDRTRGRAGAPRKQGPPWLRSVAADPLTLDPLPQGTPGLLRHLDLANIGSVAAIQTQDVGYVDEHGVVLEGRAAGATPRGCSIAMDRLLGGGK
jgi:hypothetical protein